MRALKSIAALPRAVTSAARSAGGRACSVALAAGRAAAAADNAAPPFTRASKLATGAGVDADLLLEPSGMAANATAETRHSNKAAAQLRTKIFGTNGLPRSCPALPLPKRPPQRVRPLQHASEMLLAISRKLQANLDDRARIRSSRRPRIHCACAQHSSLIINAFGSLRRC